MNALIADIENYAKNIADLGYKIRAEDFSTIKQVENIYHDIDYINSEIDKISDGKKIAYTKEKIALMKVVADLRDAYMQRDTVTIADILEYELLDVLEKLIINLEEGIA